MFKCTKMELKNYLGLLLLPLFSCSEKMEVERVEAKYELLSEDVFTRMPGNLLLADSYLVWIDPFTTDYFVHVHQVSDGKKVGVMGKQGQGPNEFITPIVSQLSYNRNIHTVDANGKTRGYLSIDSLLAGKSVARFRLDAYITAFHVDEAMKKFYGVSATEPGCVFMFDMD